MRIAVTAENDRGLDSAVCAHFGHSPYFVLVDLVEGVVVNVETVANPSYGNHRPGEVPAFIDSQHANVMLSGGMGANAIAFFERYGIDVATGATGRVKDALESYLRGELTGTAPCADHEH